MQLNSAVAPFFTNQFRTVNHDGREYLIVPGVPAREQVMNTYLVPAADLAKSVMGWNGTPITIQHPKSNGGSANVPAPDVAIIGRFYGANWDAAHNRLTGEYWIDVDEANRYAEGQSIVASIRNGSILETSTGYWADDEMTPGEFEGRQYKTIHRNLLPDHIAILTTAPGACSVKDGCGVNRNAGMVHNCDSNGDCDCPFKIKETNATPNLEKVIGENNSVHSRLSGVLHAALKNLTKERNMNLAELKNFLQGKGIVMNVDAVDDDVVFEVEETKKDDMPSLSADEISALKALAGLAPKLNEQLLKNLEAVPTVLEFAQNAVAQADKEKKDLIAIIKMNEAITFSNDDLQKMDFAMLQKLNAMSGVNYAGVAGGQLLFGNEDVLVTPTTLTSWKPAKE